MTCSNPPQIISREALLRKKSQGLFGLEKKTSPKVHPHVFWCLGFENEQNISHSSFDMHYMGKPSADLYICQVELESHLVVYYLVNLALAYLSKTIFALCNLFLWQSSTWDKRVKLEPLKFFDDGLWTERFRKRCWDPALIACALLMDNEAASLSAPVEELGEKNLSSYAPLRGTTLNSDGSLSTYPQNALVFQIATQHHELAWGSKMKTTEKRRGNSSQLKKWASEHVSLQMNWWPWISTENVLEGKLSDLMKYSDMERAMSQSTQPSAETFVLLQICAVNIWGSGIGDCHKACDRRRQQDGSSLALPVT